MQSSRRRDAVAAVVSRSARSRRRPRRDGARAGARSRGGARGGDVPVGAVVTDAAGTDRRGGSQPSRGDGRPHRARRGRRAARGRGIRRLVESRRLHARRHPRALPHVRRRHCCRRACAASSSARGTTRPAPRARCTTWCATGVCRTAPRWSAGVREAESSALLRRLLRRSTLTPATEQPSRSSARGGNGAARSVAALRITIVLGGGQGAVAGRQTSGSR